MHPTPGDLLVHQDVMTCGPLPPLRSFEQWARVRQEFWDSVSPEREPLYEDAGDVLANEAALRDADSIVVWLGICAADQIFLAWLVQALRLAQSRAKISVVQFTRVGKWNREAWGLALLNPEQIKSHPPIEALSGEVISELDRYWAAITSPDPAGLLSVLSAGGVQLPHLYSGLQILVRRYPDHRTGLGRWDLELLKYTQENGPRTVRVIGETMGNNFDADLIGDAYLFSRLLRMRGSGLAQPLVSISGDPANMRTCEVSLTATGQAVFEGRANAIELNGIDEWVLGVHLSSERGTVWYQKDGTLVLAATRPLTPVPPRHSA
jgi:hypothetical protein